MASWTLTMAVPTPNRCPTLASSSFQELATSRRSSSLSACSNSCGSSRTASRRRRRSQDHSRHVDPHAWIVGRHHVLLLDAWEPDLRRVLTFHLIYHLDRFLLQREIV